LIGSVPEERQSSERIFGFAIAAFVLTPFFSYCFRATAQTIPFLFGSLFRMLFIFVPLLAVSVLFGLWRRDFGSVVKLGVILWSGVLVWLAPYIFPMVVCASHGCDL